MGMQSRRPGWGRRYTAPVPYRDNQDPIYPTRRANIFECVWSIFKEAFNPYTAL